MEREYVNYATVLFVTDFRDCRRKDCRSKEKYQKKTDALNYSCANNTKETIYWVCKHSQNTVK